MNDMWAIYIEARASDDPVKQDLELTCTLCQKALCDIEDGDTLSVLTGMARDHMTSAHHAQFPD